MGRVKRKPNKKTPFVCVVCKKDSFYRRSVKNPLNKCKKCLSEESKCRFKENNPGYNTTDKKRLVRRAWALKTKYNLTLEDYDAMVKNQNGKCAICGEEQIREHNLCVDHDHVSGKVRGLLCHTCNQGIGLIREKGTNAARYLISHTKTSWDEYFMNMAVLASSRSKDRSTKVGSVIVKDRVIISTGYNGFPRGINDDLDYRHERPVKYEFTCHAEENAIFNAARIGANVSNSDMYVTLYPCPRCARGIIQSQIKRLFVLNDNHVRFNDDFEISREMLLESGVSIKKILV